MKSNLSKNASNRVTIESESFWIAWKVRILLMFKYKFKRKGKFISFVDQSIFFDYVKADLKIISGWDSWFSYYWSADNELTDKFVMQFYDKHLK